MDWNTRLSHTSNLQTKNFQIWGSDLPQQLTATCDFSQANASTPYSGNDQTIKMHSNTDNKIVNQLLLQNTGQSYMYKPIFSKTSVSTTDFRMPQQAERHPVSTVPLSSVTVQMQDGKVQNPWSNPALHVFSPVAVPGTTVNSVQSINQKLYVAPVIYSNCLQKNSNSVRTSVYPQSGKSSSFSKRQSTPMASYHLNGPPTSQACATVPLNPASNHLNSQQNFSCFTFPPEQNNQNPINTPRSSTAVAMQSQQYLSSFVTSNSYTVSPQSCRDATQVIPPAANIKDPPPYHALPVQASYGQLAQPVANTSSENVPNHQNLALDQNHAEQSMQYYQKPQSIQSTRELHEVGSTAYRVNEYRAADQPSNESAKPSIQALNSLCSNIQISAAPQATKTLVQEENLPNSTGNLCNITKANLMMDFRKLCDLKKAVLQLSKDLKVQYNLYISTVKNTKTSDLSAHNKSPDVSLPSPSNTTQNQTCLLPRDAKQAFKAPSQDAVLNQPLVSHGSSQSQDVSLLASKEHLFPILRDLLRDTVDEDMLNTYVAKAEKHQNGHVAFQENSSSCTPFVSGSDKCENDVKNNEETSRVSPKTAPVVPTQEPLMGTKNSLGFKQTSRPAKNQFTNISAVSGGGLFQRFKLNRIAANKILVRLQSPVQNSATSNGSLPSTKTVVKEGTEKFQSSASTCPELLQQSKNAGLQTPEKSVATRTSGSVPDASSSAPFAKAAVSTPEAGIVQKPSITDNSGTVERTCSWEELETSLALWVSNLSSPANGLISDSTESAVSLPSKGDGDKTQHTLENLPNTLTQNVQTTVEMSSVPSSPGNKLDTVSSSLSKGSEPQVAIVAPLMQSKESMQMEVQKKNLSTLFDMCPIIKEGSVRSLQELISAVPDTDRGISSIDTSIAIKQVDSVVHQHATNSNDKNGIVKAETNPSYDINQGITDDSFLELKNVKSQVSSADKVNCLNPVSQKRITSHKSDSDLLKPGDTAAVELNDTMLQISSVCTLVQGDAFYNSQIANIFNTSPLESSMANDDSSKEHVPYPQQNEQQSALLKGESETKVVASAEDILLPSQDSLSKTVAEKPSKDMPGIEIPERGKVSSEKIAKKSEEEKSNYLHENTAVSGKKIEQKFSYGSVYSIDLARSDQELSENQDLLCTTVEDGAYHTKKDDVQEHVPMEENNTQCSTNRGSLLLNDQLAELVKEYPNGINDLEVPQKIEIEYSVKQTERQDKDGTWNCGQNPGPSDATDQIKILNFPQRNEYFSEHVQSSNKSEKNENDVLIIDSEDKDGLSSGNISNIQTQQLKHIDNINATSEITVVKNEDLTYCCTQAWMASKYAVKPCSCTLTEDVGLKPQMDLCSRSKNMLKEEPGGSEGYITDGRLNTPLQTSVVHSAVSVFSGDQSTKFLENAETDLQVKKSTLSKGNQEHTPFSFLEKLDPHKPKRTNEQEMEVLSLSAGSQALKEETAEVKINDQIREDLCFDQIPPHLSTNSFKKGAVQPLSETEFSQERRDRAVAISKTDSRHHNMEIKHSKKYERYKIKHDTSETHMIKGPNRLSKGLKRQKAIERKHKILRIPHSAAINSSNLGSAGLVSKRYKNSWHSSVWHSEEHLNKQKREDGKRDLEKNNEMERLEHNEPSNSEHAQPNKESIKRINLDKYAYSKERGNAWKYKHLLLNNRKIPKVQKQRGHPSGIPKINCFGKEAVLNACSRDERSDRSEKAASFGRRISKLTLQREQKKNYLNRVSFTQTAQESICLKKLEPSPSKSIWRMKSGNVCGNSEVPQISSLSSQQPRREKPHMLEFKMCPEILFRTSVSEEQVADSKKLPEKDKTPITAVKSKREDWLNYSPAKRRKTIESKTQVEDHIPLDTALKLLDEDLHVPVKNSKTTFQTYRKMHLEKRSRSLDSSPIN